MDLSSLKNIDINDLVSKLKSSELLKDKKTLTKFGIVFGSILIFLIVYYFFVSPIVKENKAKLAIMNENKLKIEEFNVNIGKIENAIKEIEPDFNKNSKLFHSKKEVEDLYQNISNFALANGLSIININKGEPTGVEGNEANSTDQSSENSTDQSSENSSEGQGFIYFKIPVGYEIKGNFLGYLKFRRALASSSKVINFDKEEIDVLKDSQGQILSKGTISIVGLPNEYN